MIIIETPIFTRRITELLSDDEYRTLQGMLVEHPDRGDLLPGTGGLRKVRWRGSGKGTRGGLRIIYYWQRGVSAIYMLLAYSKGSQEDITVEQMKMLKRLIQEELK